MRLVAPLLLVAALTARVAWACPAASAANGRAVLTDFASPGDTDFSPAFACALTALCKDPAGDCGGELIVPKGTFAIRSTVDVIHPVRIVGMGPVSKIAWAGAAGTMFDLHPSHAVAQDFERLSLTGAADGHDACASGVAPSIATVGIHVAGARLGIKNVSICGLGTGIKSGASSGQVESLYVAGDRVGVQLEQADSWLFDALALDRNVTGLLVRRSAGISVFGLRASDTASDAVWLQSCTGCEIDGAHFVDNGVDIHLGEYPDMKGAVSAMRHVSIASVDGVKRMEVVNPAGCPVDDISLQDVAGPFKSNSVSILDVDSACPIHVSLRQSELILRRKNTFNSAGAPEVVVLQATGFAPPTATVAMDIGVPGGLPMGKSADGTELSLHSVTADAKPRLESADRSLRVLDDGRASLAGLASDATLTIAQPVGGAAVDVTGRPGIRWRQSDGRPAAGIDGVPEPKGVGIGISTARDNLAPEELIRIDAAGNVGVGTNTPAAALDVKHALRVHGTLSAKAIVVPIGAAADKCVTGALQVLPGAQTDSLRVCDGKSWRPIRLEEMHTGGRK